MEEQHNPKPSKYGIFFASLHWLFLGYLTLKDGHASPWLGPFFVGFLSLILGLLAESLTSKLFTWIYISVLVFYIILLFVLFRGILETKPGFISYAEIESFENIVTYMVVFSLPASSAVIWLLLSFLDPRSQPRQKL